MAELSLFFKSEIYRLASALNIECDDINDMTEESCTDILDNAVRSIERMKYESSKCQTESAPTKTFDSSADKKLMKKAKTLEDELKLSLNIVEDVSGLKAKNLKLMNNVKKEKEQRSILEDFIASQNKKLNILVEHIEKLMKALKIESTSKIRTADENRTLFKEQRALQLKLEKQERITATQLRLVKQLSEGSKILEDQLALMDEKYLDLRTKLDINRTQLQAQMTKVRKECDTLRVKYSLANSGALLDNVNVKKYQQSHLDTGTFGSNNHAETFDSFDFNHLQQTQFNNSSSPASSPKYGKSRPSNSSHSLLSQSQQESQQRQQFNPHLQVSLPPNQQLPQQQSVGRNRPVSAFASSSPHNVDSADRFAAADTKKVRPQTGTPSGAASAAKHVHTIQHAKEFNQYSRQSLINPGSLNLDKVVKKINRKQKLSRTDSWADADIQDLLNG